MTLRGTGSAGLQQLSGCSPPGESTVANDQRVLCSHGKMTCTPRNCGSWLRSTSFVTSGRKCLPRIVILLRVAGGSSGLQHASKHAVRTQPRRQGSRAAPPLVPPDHGEASHRQLRRANQKDPAGSGGREKSQRSRAKRRHVRTHWSVSSGKKGGPIAASCLMMLIW